MAQSPSIFAAHTRVELARQMLNQSDTGAAIVRKLENLPTNFMTTLPDGEAALGTAAAYNMRTSTMFVPESVLNNDGMLLVGIGHEGVHRIQRGSDAANAVRQLLEKPRNISAGLVGAAQGVFTSGMRKGWQNGVAKSTLRHEVEAYTLDLRRLNELSEKFNTTRVLPDSNPTNLYGYMQHIGETTGRETNSTEVTKALLKHPPYAIRAGLNAHNLSAPAVTTVVGGIAIGTTGVVMMAKD